MKDIQLNYIGKVDADDIGRRKFKISRLLTLADFHKDPELELSVQLVTENTNGQLAARVQLATVEDSNERIEEIIRLTFSQRKVLYNLLRVLVEGKDNTREFLSMASQYTDLEVPEFKEIVGLYKSIESKEQ